MPTGFESTPRVFPCPNCRETINTSMLTCKYCGAPIDAAAAIVAAEATDRISAACSDASYLQTMALVMAAFFGLRFVPFFSGFGAIGSFLLSFATFGMAVRWYLRFGRIKTSDPDYRTARLRALGALGAGLLGILVIVGLFTIGVLIAMHAHAR